MSFLLRRNRPLAWAGWADLDTQHLRSDENPIKQPWARVNSSRTVKLENNLLAIADYAETVFETGGVSFEHQPFTDYWGCEFDVFLNANTIQVQYFAAGMSYGWNNPSFQNLNNQPLIAFWREAFNGGDFVRVVVYTSTSSYSTIISNDVGAIFNNAWHSVKIWIDWDRHLRVYVDGAMYLFYTLPVQYRPGPGRRALNFLNQTSSYAYLRNFKLYDRTPDITWAPAIFSDNFNRANSSDMGANWNKVGVNSGIVSNRYSSTGTSDGSRGIWAVTPSPSGDMRLETQVQETTTTCSSVFLLRGNSAFSSWIGIDFKTNRVQIMHGTGTLTSASWDVLASASIGPDNGDVIAACVKGDYAWVEINGEVIRFAGEINALCPPTNRQFGAMVTRASFQWSPAFEYLTLQNAA